MSRRPGQVVEEQRDGEADNEAKGHREEGEAEVPREDAQQRRTDVPVAEVCVKVVVADERDEPGHDDPDRLDGQTLVDAAVEAGIPEREVLRAVAVERLGPAPAHRMTDGLLGPATVAVDEELVGSAGDAMVRLDAWLVGGHHLRRDRLRGGHGVWRKRPGVVAATFRTFVMPPARATSARSAASRRE